MEQEDLVDNNLVPSCVDCSTYFKITPLKQWSKQDYISYRKRNGSFSPPDGKLIEDFSNDLSKILNSVELTDKSERLIKLMIPMMKRKATQQETSEGPSTASYPSSNHTPIDELFEDEPLPDTMPNDFRDAVFKAGYHYFKGELSLNTIASLTRMKQGFSPKTLNEYLDVVSYNLLMKHMGPDEKNALKLSLCHILCFAPSSRSINNKCREKRNMRIANESFNGCYFSYCKFDIADQNYSSSKCHQI
ncbi:hypothetical protein FB192DRAFT_1454964, partial [Mucor lusitanicus]